MTTRDQDDRIEALALEHGRAHVRTGYADGDIEVTAGGWCFVISGGGKVLHRARATANIDWRST